MKLIISLIVAGLVIVIIFFYGLFGGSSPSNQTGTNDEASSLSTSELEEAEPEEFRGEGTLAGLEELETNLECRISYVAPDQIEPVVGTYFVSNDRVRGDFELNVPELGGEVVSSIIFKDNLFYSWSKIAGQSYGIKVDTSLHEDIDDSATRQPVPDDASVSYECREWKEVDGSIFEPPSDILFQDFSDIKESGMEYGTVYEEGEF